MAEQISILEESYYYVMPVHWYWNMQPLILWLEIHV